MRDLNLQQAEQEILKFENKVDLKFEDLTDFANRVQVVDRKAPADAVTYLYSGQFIDGISTTKVIEKLKKKPKVRVIDNTDFAIFVNENKTFNMLFDKLIIKELNITGIEELENIPQKIRSKIDKFKYSYMLNDPVDGIWGKASATFTKQTKGRVELIAPKAAYNRTMYLVELKNIFNNPNAIFQGENYEFWQSFKKALTDKGDSEQKAIEIMSEYVHLNSIRRNQHIGFKIKEFETSSGKKRIELDDIIIASDAHSLEPGYKSLSELQGLKSRSYFEKPFLDKYKYHIDKKFGAGFADEAIESARLLDYAKNSKTEFRINGKKVIDDTFRHSKNFKTRTYKGLKNVAKWSPYGWKTLELLDTYRVLRTASDSFEKGDKAEGCKVIQDYLFESAAILISSEMSLALTAALVAGSEGAAVGSIGGIPGALIGFGISFSIGLLGAYLGNRFSNAVSFAFEKATGIRRADPIILDLNGDGIHLTSVADGVYFDIDNSGFKEKTAWVRPEDGLLVMDRNNNGLIDSGAELFGDQTILSNGTMSTSGFMTLAEIDDNKDGVVDKNDSQFNKLKIWQDKNSDGVSQKSELLTLEQANVKSISLDVEEVNRSFEHENFIVRKGHFTTLSDTVLETGEFLLNRNTVDSSITPADLNKIKNLKFGKEILELPELPMTGNLYSLRQKMALDTNGKLKDLVKQFVNEDSIETRNNLIDDILFTWSDSNEIDKDSRGEYFDSRKLNVLEKYTGVKYTSKYGDNPIYEARPRLEAAYGQLAEGVYTMMLLQSKYKDLLEEIYSSKSEDFTISAENAIKYLNKKLDENTIDKRDLVSDISRIVRTLNIDKANDYFNFREKIIENAIIDIAEIDRDSFTSYDISNREFRVEVSGFDIVYDNDKKHVTKINSKCNTIYAGKGEDWLDGLAGNDIYYFNKGDGTNYITEKSSKNERNIVVFGKGISKNDIIIKRYDYKDVALFIKDTDDKIVIRNQTAENPTIQRIYFQNGEFIDSKLIKDNLHNETEGDDVIYLKEGDNYVNSLGGNDKITTGDGNDEIHSGSGDDYIECGDGNDKVYAGKGNDKIYDAGGDDNYYYELGDGNDEIRDFRGENYINFGKSIAPSDVVIHRINNDDIALLIKDNVIILKDEYNTSGRNHLKFSDGTIITPKQIQKIACTPTDMDDYLTIENENGETVYAKAGNDKIYGYKGNDIIYGEAGDDTIKEHYGNNKVYGGVGNDDIDTGYGNDFIEGGAGDDSISASEGDDTLSGGQGKDWLDGSYGNDTYIITGQQGVDTIQEMTGNDLIKFAETISLEEVKFSRGKDDFNNLVIKDKQGLWSVIVQNQFKREEEMVEQIKFKDKTLSFKEMLDLANKDSLEIFGSFKDDELIGTDADERLHGREGNDILIGGKGDDQYFSKKGINTFCYNKGDGKDRIVYGNKSSILKFGEGIMKEDIKIIESGNDCIIRFKNFDGEILLNNQLYSTSKVIGKIEFFNGDTIEENEFTDFMLASPNAENNSKKITLDDFKKRMNKIETLAYYYINENNAKSNKHKKYIKEYTSYQDLQDDEENRKAYIKVNNLINAKIDFDSNKGIGLNRNIKLLDESHNFKGEQVWIKNINEYNLD